MKKKLSRGFAVMDPELVQSIARKGGLTISKNRDHMVANGRAGGLATQRAIRKLRRKHG